jgi:hypothetical protein
LLPATTVGALRTACPPLGANHAALTIQDYLDTFADTNPHCRQVLIPRIAQLFQAEMLARPMSALPWRLGAELPRIPYHTRPDADRSPRHYGQAKLWLAEVAFLSQHTDACLGARYLVVYAGAAPGHHIPALARMFPSCSFLLYDPAPFCPELLAGALPNVAVRNEFFTNATAQRLAVKHAGTACVFISDIRTGKEEDYVEADMQRQAGWLRALRPFVSSVKFRLPWGGGRTPYFDGIVRLQAYPPLTSTETRLIVTRAAIDAPEREYDNLEYEEQLAYHNTVSRVCGYDHPVILAELDHCYDCAHMVAVIGDYLARFGRPATPPVVGAVIAASLASFNGRRTLADQCAAIATRRGGSGWASGGAGAAPGRGL